MRARLALCVVLFTIAACGKEEVGAGGSGGGGGGGEVAEVKPVLPRVETLKSPEPELYDRIQKALQLKEAAKAAGMEPPASTTGAKPLPKTLTDTFASDVQMIAFFELGLGKLEQATVTAEPIEKVLELYTKIESKYLHGYRILAHQAFVKSLTTAERKQLATELAAHIKKAGFTGDDAIGDLPKQPMKPEVAAALGGKPGGAAGSASPGTASPAASGVPLYAGKYRTSEGWMTLKQKSAEPTDVFGTYAKGTIKCKAAAEALTCDWNEGGVSKGRAKFTRDGSGNMKGTWGMGGALAGGGAWNCTLLAAGALE